MYKIVAHVVITLSAETECDGFGTGVAVCIIGVQSRSADVGFVAQRGSEKFYIQVSDNISGQKLKSKFLYCILEVSPIKTSPAGFL